MQSVWQPLLAAARRRGEIGAESEQRFAWEVFLVRDRSVNAFALPGGRVGVHLGLLALAGSRDELASVLAHELTHVTQRHVARGIVSSKRQSLLGLAAMIVGVLASSRANSSDAANAIIAGGQAAGLQSQLNFARAMAREADRIGFGLMTEAGFASTAVASMFERLDHASRLNDRGSYPYLRSHPLTSERIGEARSRLGASAARGSGSDLEHLLAQARARVLMDARAGVLRQWQGGVGGKQSADEAIAAAASEALAATLLRDWPRADTALQFAWRGVRALPGPEPRARRALALLTAQSQLARGDTAGAAVALAGLETEASDSRPTLLLAVQLALASAGTSAAVLRRHAEALQTFVAERPEDATAWSELARLWERLGQPLRSARAAAEARASIGDLDGAIERLRAGQQRARSAPTADFVEASVIDLRLRQLEGERRRLAEETREGRAPARLSPDR